MKRIYLVLTLTLLLSISMYGIDTKTRIVKGKIIDKNTGSPVALEIHVEDVRGKKFKIKSKPTGEYEQLLNSNEVYKFTFVDMNVMKEEVQFTPTAPDASFDPEIKDFQVFVMKPGLELGDYDLFEKNKTTISKSGEQVLDSLQSLLRINRALFINVELHRDDSKKDLNKTRAKTLQTIIDSWERIGAKVTLTSNSKKSKDKKAKSDFKVTIDKVVNNLK